jgi:hypothetical protein
MIQDVPSPVTENVKPPSENAATKRELHRLTEKLFASVADIKRLLRGRSNADRIITTLSTDAIPTGALATATAADVGPNVLPAPLTPHEVPVCDGCRTWRDPSGKLVP